jgi:hypothetical protein
MRTITTLLVITSLLACGFTAAAQQEGQPGSPTAPAVEGAPGSETGAVEGTPGAPTDTSAEAAPGDSTDTEDAEEEEEDRGNGGGNVDQNPNLNPQPQIVRERVIERRTQVVREIAAASRAGDQATVKRLTIELGKLNERLALVEANPLGGTEGQRRLWQDVLLPAGIKSESYLREHYGLVPVSAPETEQDTMPARPAKGGAPMPLALQIILGAVAVVAAAMAVIALAGAARRFFLRDSNREPAASAPAPESVGRRDIVTESARGDYSRETVVAADVAAAEALASAERVAAVMEVFAARAAARRGEATSAPVAPSAVTVNASSDAGAVAAAAPAPQEIVIRVVGGEPPATPKEEAKKEEPPKKAAPKATPKKEAPKEEAK